MNSKIKNIILDIGGVLLHLNFERASQKLSSFSEQDSLAIQQVVLGPDKNMLERGRLSEYKFYNSVARKIQAELSYDDFRNLWCDIFDENHAMSSLVDVLDQDYNLVLASNTNSMHFDFILELYPFIKKIQHRALSYEMGLLKPEREFFEQMLRKFRMHPSNSLLIDDSAENVEGALKAGISGIIYRNHEHLLDQLDQLGIPLRI